MLADFSDTRKLTQHRNLSLKSTCGFYRFALRGARGGGNTRKANVLFFLPGMFEVLSKQC